MTKRDWLLAKVTQMGPEPESYIVTTPRDAYTGTTGDNLRHLTNICTQSSPHSKTINCHKSSVLCPIILNTYEDVPKKKLSSPWF